MLLLGLWRWPRLSSPPWTEWVWESERRKERGRLSALYKELVLLMKSPWQMGLILEVSHNHRDLQLAHMHTHILALVKCAPDSLSLPFLALFTLCLSHPAFLSSSLCSSFIHRKIWLKRPGFQAKKLLPCTPPPLDLPPPAPLLPLSLLSPPASGFVHTSSKKPLFQADYLWPAVWRRALYVITPCSRQRHRWVWEIKMLQALSPLIGFPQFRAHPPKYRWTLYKKPVMLKHTFMHILIYVYPYIYIRTVYTSMYTHTSYVCIDMCVYIRIYLHVCMYT